MTLIMTFDDLMTPDEHEVVRMLGECYTRYCKLGLQKDLDRNEFAAEIHNLQARVMSRAASRAYPDLYRIL